MLPCMMQPEQLCAGFIFWQKNNSWLLDELNFFAMKFFLDLLQLDVEN